MIRFSTNNDIDKIISLWHEAFGDSEDEIRFFLDNKFTAENTLVSEENGEIASMLFLLDGRMSIKGTDYPAYYLYAACTAQKYRGRGLMASLLKFAQKTAYERKTDFICLMPGEKSLFNFYEKHGYLTTFSRKILTVSRTEIQDIQCENTSDSAESELENLRNSAFEGTDIFKWDDKSVLFAMKQTELYGGYTFLGCKGYILYTISGTEVTVKEFAFNSQDLTSVLSLLAKKHIFDNIVLNLPSDYPTNIGSYKIIPSAMMLPINENARLIASDIKNAYLGLTLD